MTDWTPKDTARLRGHFGLREDVLQDTLDDADFVGRAAAHIESLEARVAELEAREDERAALLSQAISHAREMEARHEKTTSHTLELYAMLSQRNARIATLEATNAEQARRLEEIIGRENRWDEYERTGVWPERFNLGMYFDVRRLDGYWQKLVMEHDAAKTRIAALEADQERLIEAERANAIPRAVLVGSLRKRLRQATAPGGASCSSDMRRDAIAETLRGLIREIERGEWPGEGER